jgi:AcrR family transcriptional regulator
MAQVRVPKAAPQQERSIETRRRLLDATFKALVETGHAGTTTQEVCRRAGVPRGTLLHHFENRALLLTAALEHVIERRMRDFRRDVAKLSKEGDRVTRVVDLLWRRIKSPTFYAWLELVVAARTDAELRGDVRRMMKRLNAEVKVIFSEIFPAPEAFLEALPGGTAVAPDFTLGLLYGLAVTRIYQGDQDLQPVLEALKQLGMATQSEA